MDARQLLDAARHVVVFTGAGISTGSGLPTYRGAGGLYDDGRLPPLHVRDLRRDRLPALWAHVEALRAAAVAAEPSAAHRAVAAFADAQPPDATTTVVTQNVDGLHGRAGGRVTVHELHGTLSTVSCLGRAHRYDWDVPPRDEDGVPRCPQCRSRCRPDVVLFGQVLPSETVKRANAAVTGADVVVVVGTSLQVFPAAGLVDRAVRAGVPVLSVNPEPVDVAGVTGVPGTADEVLVELLTPTR